MARQLRLHFANATHHNTPRGNERKDIFFCDDDREKFLEYLGETVRRYGWLITAWVLMSNHFHLVLETPSPTLSAGMQWLLRAYSQWFNKKHKRSGHLFGDRFHSFLIDSDTYLTGVARYVVLNPVRALLAERVGSTESPWDRVRHGMFLGTDLWIRKMRKIVESKPRSSDHPKRQRSAGRPIMPRVIETVARIAGGSPGEIRNGRV